MNPTVCPPKVRVDGGRACEERSSSASISLHARAENVMSVQADVVNTDAAPTPPKEGNEEVVFFLLSWSLD